MSITTTKSVKPLAPIQKNSTMTTNFICIIKGHIPWRFVCLTWHDTPHPNPMHRHCKACGEIMPPDPADFYE